MTLIQRLRHVFSRQTTVPAPMTSPVGRPSACMDEQTTKQPVSEAIPDFTSATFSQPEPLPEWLLDDEILRDEGVLFGLSSAHPDGKIAEIRAAFAQQSAPLDAFIEQYTEHIRELTSVLEQRETQLRTLLDQIAALQTHQPIPTNLIRTLVSLCLSVVMCIGNFYLVDDMMRPLFPNRWIAVGVFLAGIFNSFGRTSFVYETDTRLSGRRLIEEIGLPLATSVFILVQALRTQSAGSAIGLFLFVFSLFLLAGKLLPSLLTALQNDAGNLKKNRQLALDKEQNLPRWGNETERLEKEVGAIRAQTWPDITALNHAQADLIQLNTKRDRLVHLFRSEFELARSLHERLTEPQRRLLMNYE